MQKRQVKVGDVICIHVGGTTKPATVTRVAAPNIVSVEPQKENEPIKVGGKLFEYSEEKFEGTWHWADLENTK